MEQQTPREPGAAINGHPVPDLLDTRGDDQTPDPSGGTVSGRPSGWRARLRPDRFVLRGIAVLGAAGVFGSLITEWQRYDVPLNDGGDLSGAEVTEPIRVYLDQLGVLAFGYLGAAIALIGCVALVLFGRASGRAQSRVLALAMAGAALACGAAVILSSDSETIRVGGLVYLSGEVDFSLHTEKGTWFALAGVALLGLAAFLAPRPRAVPAVASGPESDPDADEWRQPVVPRHADETPGAPLDLSVEPVEPFQRSFDDRREPWR
ncbi:hypothetical protein J2S43_007086 [Catenuloplanes nepalensis]|uniref:TIGR02234 family membrane protein n=1 Tax=Catenuloplanes nepalensis TaxID=587533 RepID=A0ABT9N4E6_9ACTN|nr:hypothetical protein [Catenuloplanes nepalensis]MDP9798574.1 hypothetical protein [Catenuloplanes nepalensis]